MPAYNFQKRFAGLVESGAKRQTIRRPRKRLEYPSAGDRFVAYTGMRTKSCRKLIDTTIAQVEEFILTLEPFLSVYVGGEKVGLDAVAKADGFADGADMLAWFQQAHFDKAEFKTVFFGHIIYW